MKNVELIHWLDDRGYGLFIEVQADNTDGEYILARAAVQDGALVIWEEMRQSKYKAKCMERYLHEMKTNKEIIMDVRETLEGLTIKQLKSLLPSYYQLVIERRIQELENATKTQ